MTRRIVPIVAAMLASCSPAKREPMPDLSGVPAECTQALVVLPGESAIRVRVSQWERAGSGWRKLVKRPGVIGRNGFAPIGEKHEAKRGDQEQLSLGIGNPEREIALGHHAQQQCRGYDLADRAQ